MKSTKHARPEGSNDSRQVNWAFGAEEGIESENYELDQIVRKLALDKWFALAEEGTPFWAL